MKALLSLVLLIASTAAVACPNLSGQFQCYDDEEGYYMNTISQSGSGSQTTYTVVGPESTDSVTANNQWSNVIQSGQQVRMKASCADSKLVMDVEFEDPNAGKVTAQVKMSINSSSDLQNETTITIGGYTIPAQTSNCVRQ